MAFLDKLHDIKAFVFDVDGVLTNGDVYVTDKGDHFRQFNIKDGYALQLAVKCGYKVCAISGAGAEAIRVRLNNLGVEDVYLSSKDKPEVFHNWLQENQLDATHVLFMGDDIPDLGLMGLAGLPVCPADAVEEIKAASQYISPIPGGKGCVRDVIEKVMKVQGNWMGAEAYSW
ncbi:3-deoxy-D-manno-octulosonate 8-phosphate phosphatase (KDO 8-P phosphatase) [Mucilaginibacter yixingensis]|uniref:3-deoxy-D-manno-octulosonate 8-phosphate phosphatase (KDO 8-P phosphatase) n=1 Tax=Mucilaginibacter yixingensis TaxID=1295612 RepID=A0A2T5J5T5_9SPHI|nr:HAD-IIIA family hydrolase [Mucilaginibacter yixingensis]PTQ93626.1 3-deoxy-D-manno-octulosonate 8-phosphate phosphatase (KDO 8-P phosphatase) [Mucilaginibacter yixingensis]